MAEVIQIRRGTAANAASINPILELGEIVLVIDGSNNFTGQLKVGNGTSAYNDLTLYDFGVSNVLWGGISGTLANQTDLQTALDVKLSIVNFQQGTNIFDVDTGIADAYDITLSPAVTSYVEGSLFIFKTANVNTGPSTLSVNGLAALPIIRRDTGPLVAGDIPAGSINLVIYDESNGGRFQLIGGIGSGGGGGTVIVDGISLGGDGSVGTPLEVLNNGVSNGKLADMAQDTIKGRITGSTGDPEDLTPAQVRTIINVENGAAADQSAAEVPVTPVGNLTQTNVQAALEAHQTAIDVLNDEVRTAAVLHATVSNIGNFTIKANVEAALDTVSSVAPVLADGDLVLVKSQTNAVDNGVYRWNNSGTVLERTGESLSGGDVFFVQLGDTQEEREWFIDSPTGDVNIGVDNIAFKQVPQGASTTITFRFRIGPELDIRDSITLTGAYNFLSAKLYAGISSISYETAPDAASPTYTPRADLAALNTFANVQGGNDWELVVVGQSTRFNDIVLTAVTI